MHHENIKLMLNEINIQHLTEDTDMSLNNYHDYFDSIVCPDLQESYAIATEILKKVKFIFDFGKWRSNFYFFQKWLQPVERSRKRLKKTYKVKFCFMQK